LIIGSGDVWEDLKTSIRQKGLQEKVTMINKLPKDELYHYTANADLGLSIDKNTNLNYLNSLPNKIFDYIQAEIPILASKLLEVEKIISRYKIGFFINNHSPKHIAETILKSLETIEFNEMKQNLKTAKNELSWRTEQNSLISIIHMLNK
jgi:glycosyltransferase involved in cell wall biosynthesis